ncbi:acyltransferase family protein [Pseudoteredinibacter isoporae]|uniref:Fucose 4-O-acetylase-like acetyltransferase n=1 Tax=Pseudoteredinibacter isoporae TaxID=570281 RepID=A0A7X0MWW6_9GAMM|nr:acyltransferase family protein [Pseudoteredinibacter isoporae]MBB6522660.1 fucose 4-O-acetylase-like acetyltransferase [Pseudoteredinibacter isoporae]NHO88191.1 acyltransferase family protein [Pseudoteredinibacter isoporae]NIB23478.1 acyltransferase family protein [Pseudoteredinibacter isoporae]
MNNQGERYHGLDFLRALMMCLGVVLHSAQLYTSMDITDYYWDPARSFSMDVLLITINTFRMPVFFVLSGFFTALLLDRHGFEAMWHNRMRRLLLPFLLLLPPLSLIMGTLRIFAYNLMRDGQPGFDLDVLEGTGRSLWNNTHNLWFLYYLLLYLLCIKLFIKPPMLARMNSLIQEKGLGLLSPGVFLPTVILMAILGGLHNIGRIGASLSFIPKWDVFLFFAACFGLGWLLYQNIGQLQRLIRYRWWTLLLAILSLLIAFACFAVKEDADDKTLLHIALSLFTAISVYSFICAFIGLFNHYLNRYNRVIRYVSDSAYWIFVFHSIPLVVIALPMYYWSVAAEIKFLITCGGTYVVCFWTYHYWVRSTRMGELLNGRKQGAL